MVPVMRADIVARSALVGLEETDGISQGRPIDEIELLGYHSFVGVELSVHQRSELCRKLPVVFSQFTPAPVAGQSGQFEEALLRIEPINMQVVVLERGEVPSAALQLVDPDKRPRINEVVKRFAPDIKPPRSQKSRPQILRSSGHMIAIQVGIDRDVDIFGGDAFADVFRRTEEPR